MVYKRLLFNVAIIAFFVASAYAEAGDPLDPGQLGESMSMPMPQDLLQAARESGVITGSNSLYESDSKKSSFSVMPRREADVNSVVNSDDVNSDDVNSIDNVNVTGTWSFDLKGAVLEQMKLYLVQNEDMIIGQGIISRQNRTDNATVSGSLSGDKLNLIVMPVGVMDLYNLNLSLSTLAAGTYTAHMADGSSRSGDLTFSVSSNIFKPASSESEDGSAAYASADAQIDNSNDAITEIKTDSGKDKITNGYAAPGAAASTPLPLGGQGQGGRISTSKTTSMSSSGGSMSTSSSYGSSF